MFNFEKILFKNGEAPYINDINLNQMQDNIKSAMVELDNKYIYSSNEEIIVGEWIDGRPVYRKVINCETLPNATSKYVYHRIENIDFIISDSGFAVDNSGNRVDIPYLSSDGFNSSIYVSSNRSYISLETKIDRTRFANTYIILIYVKTANQTENTASEINN